MALTPRCVECPDREFDNLGSARGHTNRLHHTLIQVEESLVEEQEETAITAYPVMTGEMGESLASLSTSIREAWQQGESAVQSAWDARFAIAKALLQARELLRGDLEFGRWIKEQDFPFGSTRAKQFLRIAQHEAEARELVGSTTAQKQEIGLDRLVREVDPPQPREPKPVDDPEMVELPAIEKGSVADLLTAFVWSPSLEALLALDPQSEEVLAVPAEIRNSMSREFKRICERLIAINQAWKDNPSES